MLITILVALCLAILLSELGCIVLWQRYAYFGDGLAHACILSGSINMLFAVPAPLAVAITALLYSTLVKLLSRKAEQNIAVNISANMMLAVALLLNSKFGNASSINTLLLGDILLVTEYDLYLLIAITLIIGILLKLYLPNLILFSFNKELAQIYGINVKLYETTILAILALSITLIIPICGGLLCTAMLVLPAATARMLSTSPQKMIVISTILSTIANIAGILSAVYLDLPISPAIVVIGAVLYCVLNLTYNKAY